MSDQRHCLASPHDLGDGAGYSHFLEVHYFSAPSFFNALLSTYCVPGIMQSVEVQR